MIAHPHTLTYRVVAIDPETGYIMCEQPARSLHSAEVIRDNMRQERLEGGYPAREYRIDTLVSR
jgi:hypothetical protein